MRQDAVHQLIGGFSKAALGHHVEKIAFNTSHFAAMLASRMSGGAEGVAFTAGSMSMDPLTQLTPGQFLSSPGLWLGLAVAAAFLAAAVRLRRYQGPI